MHDTTINQRGLQPPVGHALIELLARSAHACRLALSRWRAALAAARSRRRARHELLRLSDRTLRDIGFERDQIDDLFH